MPNAKTASTDALSRVLLVGPTGSGKTSQMHTLPGKKFAYIFDPGALSSLKGLDLEYELFLPDVADLDATLKGFNKGAKDDKPASAKEPKTYMRWVKDLNDKAESGFFKDFDWICFDSLTFLSKAIFDRQLFINGRFGGIEDLADYRVVGSKLSEVFRSVTGLPNNIMATGHIDSFQDDKTKRIEVQLSLPGSARRMLPLLFTDILLCSYKEEDGKSRWSVRSRPEERGLKTIRTSIRDLPIEQDVTIEDFTRPTDFGLGKLLTTKEKPTDAIN
jgi:GTPase SAR1 family protein